MALVVLLHCSHIVALEQQIKNFGCCKGVTPRAMAILDFYTQTFSQSAETIRMKPRNNFS